MGPRDRPHLTPQRLPPPLLTDKALRRGIFHSVPDLIEAIETYLAVHNEDSKPLIWTATAESVLEKVARGRVALNQATKTGTRH